MLITNHKLLQPIECCYLHQEHHYNRLPSDSELLLHCRVYYQFIYLANTTAEEHSNSTRFSDIDNTFFGWGSVEHKFLINSKLYALRDILDCGADAFITDTDIGFRQDPRPSFAIHGPEGDIIAQNDTNNAYQLRLNSGFMYWKNTKQN